MADAVTLHSFASDHFATLIGWFDSEADLVQWAGPTLLFPLDDAQCKAMLAEAEGPVPQRLIWTAMSEEGHIVGHAQLALDWRNGVARPARVGIAPDARGHGYGFAMMAAVVERAFSLDGMERLELNVYTFNKAAIRTYEKLGFVHEGVRRSCARVGEERWDMAMMGLLRSEYRPTGGGDGAASP